MAGDVRSGKARQICPSERRLPAPGGIDPLRLRMTVWNASGMMGLD
jgi:hypothetical protein